MILLSCRTDKLVGKEVATNAHSFSSRALTRNRGRCCCVLHLQMAG